MDQFEVWKPRFDRAYPLLRSFRRWSSCVRCRGSGEQEESSGGVAGNRGSGDLVGLLKGSRKECPWGLEGRCAADKDGTREEWVVLKGGDGKVRWMYRG